MLSEVKHLVYKMQNFQVLALKTYFQSETMLVVSYVFSNSRKLHISKVSQPGKPGAMGSGARYQTYHVKSFHSSVYGEG